MEESPQIDALRRGDTAAFASFVKQYQHRVFNVCLGFVANREDAEDLAQEVFVEVFRRMNQFRGESALGTWVHRIAVTKSLELLRYRKREKRQAYFKQLLGLDAPGVEARAGHFDHPGVALEDQERARLLYQAIDHLPENQRIAFSLRQIEGLSQKECAEIMDISEKAVESLQIRAKNKLREWLKTYYEQKA